MEPTAPNRVRIRKTKPSFNKEQKAGFGLAIGIGVLAFLTGVFYIGNHLGSPFVLTYDGPAYVSPSEREQEALRALTVSDTDEDGITDYDEIYVYKTSPYLADTDGDGLMDWDEIQLEKNPNCPEGVDCGEYITQGDAESTLPEDLLESSQTLDNSMEEFRALLSGLSPDEVRQILIEGGADADLVASLSDDEVMAAYQDAVGALEDSGQLEEILQAAQDLEQGQGSETSEQTQETP